MIIVVCLYVQLVTNIYLNTATINRTQLSLSRNPKEFSKFIRKNKTSTGIPSLVNFNNVSSENNSDTIHLFAKHFHFIYIPIPLLFIPIQLALSLIIMILLLTMYIMIHNVLCNNFSLDLHGVSGEFLFNLKDSLFCSLLFLFRKSFDKSKLPSIIALFYHF